MDCSSSHGRPKRCGTGTPREQADGVHSMLRCIDPHASGILQKGPSDNARQLLAGLGFCAEGNRSVE